MEKLWPSYVLLILFSATAVSGAGGLSCVNDFVQNVSCTWSSSAAAAGVCWIHGTKKIWILEGGERFSRIISQSCQLPRRQASPVGCSFIFENEELNSYEFNNISVACDGKVMANLSMYEPKKNIKMNPPGAPSVSSTANETCISWSPGSPLSDFITSFSFQVQIKLSEQMWKEGKTLSTHEQRLKIPAGQLKGRYQVRVRVKPSGRHNGHWSNWSPAASWSAASPAGAQERDGPLQPLWAAMPALGFLVMVLVFYLTCVRKGRLKVKPVPNPSRYFHSIHSAQGGNLKKWLNPLSASESYFMAKADGHISRVEVCESWDTVSSASPSPSSTTALLHPGSFPPDTSKVADNSSSSSSSCFSNMGYFMSSTSSSIVQSDPNPAYFTYQEDFHHLYNGRRLHLVLSPSFTSFTSSSTYEHLKREPQSPDSGFSIERADKEETPEETSAAAEGDEGPDGAPASRFLVLPQQPPSWACLPSALPPPHLPSLNQICSDSQEEEEEEDEDVAAVYSNSAAWPVSGTVSRSSSMPAEPCKTGYLTIKDLQATFSNKSI